MKLFNKFLLLAFSIALFATSCSSDDDAVITASAPLGAYENGYFILSEGGSASTTSAIDFVSNAGVITKDIYRIENPAEVEIGSYLQSIFFDATRAFIVSGTTNSITVVNRFTFKHIATISADLENPRYGVVVNGKAYVTNRASFGSNDDDYVTVVDLSNYATSKIELDVIAEQVAYNGGNLIITNGGWQVGNTVTFLDIATSTVNTVDLGAGNYPNSLVIEDSEVLLLTDAKKIVKVDLNTQMVNSSIDLPSSIASTSKLQLVDGKVYFKGGSAVYGFNLDTPATISTTPIVTFTGSFYGLNVTKSRIYITDAKDYNSLGEAFEYSIDGDLLNSYDTSGFTPNGVYFN